MKDVDPSTPLRTSLDRLRRAASKDKDEAPAEMPLGVDTRVVALSRRNGSGAALGTLLRRVALAAAAVIILATGGARVELDRSDVASHPPGHDLAPADPP